MNRAILFSALLGLSTSMAHAAEPMDGMQDFLNVHIMPWAQSPNLVTAIEAQNTQTAGYNAAQIDALDKEWRAEVGMGNSALVEGVMTNELAEFLRARVGDANGMITEVFVMDAQGLNVAASSPTSDYWQGDEAKHQETYGKGAGAVHFSEIEFDESSQTYQAQISLTIVDEAGAPIGAMTVGIDAEALM